MLEGHNMLYWTFTNIIYHLHYKSHPVVSAIVDSTNITLDIGLKSILVNGDNKQTILFATLLLLRCNTNGQCTFNTIICDPSQQISIVLTCYEMFE